MNKRNLLKIIVPVCIVLAVAGIWLFKNAGDKVPEAEPTPAVSDFVLEATSIDLESLKSYGIPIIIDFGADSCVPCKEMAPVLKTMNEAMQGVAIIKFVDVWKYSDVVGDFPIEVIPTQVFITAQGEPYVPSEDMGVEFIQYNSSQTGEHAFTVHQGGLTEEEMRAILADMGVEQ